MPFSPRRVQVLFLAVTLLFAGALGWLGWRLLQQDRALARQRRVEQLEAAADRVSAAIYRRVAELEEALAEPANARLPPGAVIVRASRGRVEVRPPNGLLYHPVLPASPEPPPGVFADGEALEFRNRDPAAAAQVFRSLTRSADPVVRAGALVRLGRSLAKCGRAPAALRAFDELASLGATPVGGLPAELVALEATCSLLEKLGRRSDLEREALVLYAGLTESRWRLLRASYDFKIAEARAWLGVPPDADQWEEKAAISAATGVLWAEWRQDPVSTGRRFLTTGGRPVLAAWVSSAEELTALLAPAAALRPALAEAGDFSARMIDADGRVLLGTPEPPAAARVERSPASTRLPWTLQVTAPDDGTAGLAGRVWLLTGSFILLVGLLGAVSYLAARATSKELAVARLQADFVSAVSHEFRSPLSSICQISELLNDDRWPSHEHRKRGHEILGRESTRLRRLVEGLLDFARMEAGAAHYRLEPLPPGEVVRSVAEEFQMQSASGHHNVRLSIAPDLPEIDADREALGRAVWNLLDNAVKYSPGSTAVHVKVSTKGGRPAISVRDEGIGIPHEERKAIFRKFVRGRQAKARGLKGTGIGLAMVRHIVEGHGGEVRVDSEPDRGSTFTIVLPARRLP